MDEAAFRQRLKQVIGKRSDREVALAYGVPPSTLSAWLRKSDPRFFALADLAAAENCSLDWLAYGTPSPAIDEAALAGVIADVEAALAGYHIAPADRARVIHLLYMDALEHAGASRDRARLLRLVGIIP